MNRARLALVGASVVFALAGCEQRERTRPPLDGPLGARGQAQYIGNCSGSHGYGLLRSAEELAANLGACRLDPRVAKLDWGSWSIVALRSGVPRVRGKQLVAETVHTPVCATGNPEPQPWELEAIHAADPNYLPPAYYYVVPRSVETVSERTRTRRKRCSRFRASDPPPV